MHIRRFFIIGLFALLTACSPSPEETPTVPETEAPPISEVTAQSEAISTVAVVPLPRLEDEALIAFYADIPHYRAEDGAFILGQEDAPIKVIEFADFLCPHCQDYHLVMEQFIRDFVIAGQAKLEYRFFPVIDQNASPYLAVLNQCADEQGKFWATHSLIYDLAKNRQIDGTILETVARRLNMNITALNICMTGVGPFQYQIDTQYGRELSVNGTPAIRVQVAGMPVGVLKIGDVEYARGGVGIDALIEFVNNEDPMANVVLINRVLVDNLLVDDSLIRDDENCLLPCWRGIFVGETTLASAQAILDADDTVANVTLQEGEARSGILFSQAGQERICCQVISNGTGNVDYISLQFTSDIILGQVLERYGEPNLADAQLVTRDQAMFTLFYVDVPMIVYAFAGLPSDVLSEESIVVGLALPSADILAIFLEDEDLRAWTGFSSYQQWHEESQS